MLKIYDHSEQNVAPQIFSATHPKDTYIITSQGRELPQSAIERLAPIIEKHRQGQVNLFVASNVPQKIETVRHQGIEVYYMDPVELKSFVRARYGVVGLQNGEIQGKWALLNTPWGFDRNSLDNTRSVEIVKNITVAFLYLLVLAILFRANYSKAFRWKRKG